MRPRRAEGVLVFLAPLTRGVGGVGFTVERGVSSIPENAQRGRTHRHSGESWKPFLRLLSFVGVPTHRRGRKRRRSFIRIRKWIPAFAGMTNKTALPRKDRSRPRTGAGACLYGRETISSHPKENPGGWHRGFPVSLMRRYLFFFFRNDLWHAPHCLPMRPTAFLMAPGPPL